MAMEAKKSMVIVFAIGTVVLLCVALFNTNTGNELIKRLEDMQSQSQSQVVPQTSQNEILYKAQRNELSKILNEMKKLYGQQSCNMLTLRAKSDKTVNTDVSENGGWCSHKSGAKSTSHMWDQGFSTALSKFLKGKTVGSFGDGPGMYKQHLDKLAEVKSYTAYDGAPFCESTTEGRVRFLDFTAPQYGIPAFDWVVSVEVGEHIPAKFEDIYLDNLARHAKEGIILSWGVPGQGGLSHINNKPLKDVVAQMAKRGFSFNSEDGKSIRDSASFPWLRKNVFVYRRNGGFKEGNI